MCLVLLYHRIGSKDLLGNDSDILLNCQKICPGALQIPPKEGQKPDTTGQSRLSTYGQDYPTDDLISLINFDPDFTKLPTPLAEDEQKANKLSLKLFVLDCVYHQVCLKQLQAEKLEKIKGELNTLQGQTPHLIVKAKAEGDIELIGPATSVFRGGTCGTYIRTKPGKGSGSGRMVITFADGSHWEQTFTCTYAE